MVLEYQVRAQLEAISNSDQLGFPSTEYGVFCSWTVILTLLIYLPKNNKLTIVIVTGRNKTPFLCPWGRVALSFGRVAQRDRTTASCGPFTSWTERSQGCELRISKFFQLFFNFFQNWHFYWDFTKIHNTRNRKHRRAAAKPAACAKPLMLSTLESKGKRKGV